MASKIFHINKKTEYQKAGTTDLIELLPAPGNNSIFVFKWILETLVSAIASNEFIHLSGPTGSGKSAIIEALFLEPKNFMYACKGLDIPFKPLKLFPIEMAVFETPGELYTRRSLKQGNTYDEKSILVKKLEKAASLAEEFYVVIWLREIGRVHSPSVQGGLLDLMTKNDILLPDDTKINGQNIAWIADSNYQAEDDSTHILVTLDDALKRRFTVPVTLNYLPPELDILVLKRILKKNKIVTDQKLVDKIVRLGQLIRRHRAEGNLLSLTPPTLYGYLAFFRMANLLPHLPYQQLSMATLLGHGNTDDQKILPGLFNEIFGIRDYEDENSSIPSNIL